jgi:hypothetical protein
LFLPIAFVLAFPFNDNQGRFKPHLGGLHDAALGEPAGRRGLGEALRNSLLVAGISTAVALVLGTLMALALGGTRFPAAGPLDMFVFLPLATPEVVLGAALLGLFITMGVGTGFVTIVIAHVMFSVAYVVVTMRARLEGLDRSIEEAAQDLGATGLQTFRWSRCRRSCPGSSPPGCSRSPSRSTTSSSRTSPPARRRRSRCSSTAPPARASRRRSTSSRRSSSSPSSPSLALNYVVQRGKGRRGNDMVPERTAVAPGLAQ